MFHLRSSGGRHGRRTLAPAALVLPAALAASLVFWTGCNGSPQGEGGENGDGGTDQAAEYSLPEKSHIVLITVDTLRADHMSAYGYARNTSPTLKRLADEGVRFDRAAVQWPKTGPSFASMMTSTHPSDNGIVRKVGIEVPCTFRMLAEILKEQGYSTHAVVANGALAAELGYNQGFDTYGQTWKQEVTEEGADPNDAAAVNRMVEPILETLDPEKPFFLWVHYLDPHFPYTPPAPYSDMFQDDEHFDESEVFEVSDRPMQQLVKVGFKKVLEERTDLAFYKARYDAEIAYTDFHINALLENMENRGLMNKTLTVMTSDHGESLGEHYFYFDHGRFGFDTCLNVPLIFHYPGQLPPRVVNEPVALVDLAPTLLQIAGVELEDGRYMQGKTMMPRLFGQVEPENVVFSEAGNEVEGKWQRIAQNERFKLIYARSGKVQRFMAGKGEAFALYDIENDPGETQAVGAEYPEELEALKKALWAHTRDDPFSPHVDTSATCAQFEGMNKETESQLKALGYLQ